MSSLSLKQLLPMKQEKKVKNAQGRIPASLYDSADHIIHKYNWNWSQVMKALVEKFVSEFEEKPTPDSFQLRKINLEPEPIRSVCK